MISSEAEMAAMADTVQAGVSTFVTAKPQANSLKDESSGHSSCVYDEQNRYFKNIIFS